MEVTISGLLRKRALLRYLIAQARRAHNIRCVSYYFRHYHRQIAQGVSVGVVLAGRHLRVLVLVVAVCTTALCQVEQGTDRGVPAVGVDIAVI
jgi:hypothetical protein